MTLSAVIFLFTRLIFLLLGAMALRDLWRYRDQTRADIVLMFAVLIVAILIGAIPTENVLVTALGLRVLVVALAAHPYLLLRLIHSFQPVPAMARRIATVGLVLAILFTLFAKAPAPAWVTLYLVGYFVVLEIYDAYMLFRSTKAASGVSRWRLIMIGTGTLMLAASILALRSRALLSVSEDTSTVYFQILFTLAAVTYFLGFAPPRWLRRYWQLNELHRFLRYTSGHSINQDTSQVLSSVSHAATRAVGANAACVLLGEKSQNTLAVEALEGIPLDLKTMTLLEDGAAARGWYLQQRDIARTPDAFGLQETPLIVENTHAQALFAIPIATAIHEPGILLLFLRQISLFAEDDLAMLSLFAEQSAITLDNIQLLAAQRDLVHRLKQNEARLEELVKERTSELSRANQQLSREAAERRRVAEELEHLNEELEQRVEARTMQLEEANRELESFAYSVSHDLRAPLRAIDGFSKALLEDYEAQLDEGGKHYLGRVRANAQRMAELIEALLKLSRMGRAEMYNEAVDLSEMAHSILSELQKRESDREVQFSIEPDLLAQGDVRLLRVVLWNLLENAWKFSGKRDLATIEFGAANSQDQQAFFVRDNGAGFDMSYADKLFGAFQRLHTGEEFPGTGIGLATVQRIIHRHNGRVWAQAVPEEGATFFFTLGALEGNHDA